MTFFLPSFQDSHRTCNTVPCCSVALSTKQKLSATRVHRKEKTTSHVRSGKNLWGTENESIAASHHIASHQSIDQSRVSKIFLVEMYVLSIFYHQSSQSLSFSPRFICICSKKWEQLWRHKNVYSILFVSLELGVRHNHN